MSHANRIGFGGAMLIAATFISGCANKVEPARIDVNPKIIPSQQSWNTDVTFSDSGRTRALLHAGHVAIYDATHTTELDSSVRVDFFSSAGLHNAYLTSQSATVDDQTKNMIARGTVVVVSDSGTTLDTEVLQWDNKRQKIHSDQFVRIVSPQEILQGYGFEADQDLKNYVIYKISGQKR